MEKNRKNLKICSIVVLALAALSLVRMIINVCKDGFGDIGQLPEGISEDVAQVALVIVWVIGVLFLIPQIYIGIKGIKLSKNPMPGRGHMVWALVIAVLSVVSLISAISDISKVYTFDKLLTVFDLLLNVAIFGMYYYCARQIAKEL